jgi:hypothetical protein
MVTSFLALLIALFLGLLWDFLALLVFFAIFITG